jgi:hypothetical protein
MPALKKALASRGFLTRDIVLKDWTRRPPEATVLTHDESKYQRLEAQRTSFERVIKEINEELQEVQARNKEWKDAPLAELNKKYAIVEAIQGFVIVGWDQLERFRKERGVLPPFKRITETDRNDHLEVLHEVIDENQSLLKNWRDKLARVVEEKGSLNVENLEEQRRITDHKAKLSRLLADVDLLLLPQPTIFNLVRGDRISPEVYKLEPDQVEAIKDFLKAGKPMLFCLGPSNQAEPSFDLNRDAIEELLTSLGLELPKQTILYDVDGEALADKSERVLMLTTPVEPPPVEYDLGASAARLGKSAPPPNPIRDSLRLTSRSFGKSHVNDLRVRSPRPVYAMKPVASAEAVAGAAGGAATPMGPLAAASLLANRSTKKVDESAVFLMSSAEAWNEKEPFPTEKGVPKYERTKSDDPRKGTLEEEKRGPFPIGVALEAQIPAVWYGDKPPAQRPKVRLAVIGHGGVFIGDDIKPMNEKLFLDTANWLLGRDDLLARASTTWQYERIELSDSENILWQWATRLGLPLAFVYLGMVMWLVRRMR